ncbi:MAG: hypothetical protein J5879_03920 [Clostridia bacterium]|nr:hypothetical protein [Clostridia bacterium]
MTTEKIRVTSSGKGIDEALKITEALGCDAGLDRKHVLHLRLLAEELSGMLRGIAGDVEADYWIENEGKSFEIHMKSDVNMTDAMRDQFLSASSSGKNAAARSFVGKIRVFIADSLLAAKQIMPYAMINTAAAYPMGGATGEFITEWSMSSYRNEINKNIGKDKEAKEAWDELEKSIIANIADEIKVRIIGKNVETVIYKTF